MTKNELVLAKNVVKVIDPAFKVDKNADWAALVESVYDLYKEAIPEEIRAALLYYALDENRGSWKEFLTYLNVFIYDKYIKQKNENINR